MSNFIDIYAQPRKVVDDLLARPTYFAPLAIVAILAMAMTIFYFSKVDPDWFMDYTLASSGKEEMSANQLAEAKKAMPSVQVMAYVTSAFAPMAIVALALIYALYLFIVSKVAGRVTTFRQALSLTAWANMPQALGALASMIAIATMVPQTGLDSVMLTNVDPLFFELPVGHPWGQLAKSFSLLTIWNIVIVAIGWRAWGKSGWLQAFLVSAFPAIVVYGGMAVVAALK